ncbi:metalloregulator ArsR/SmtB family transcription factor [Demequina sp. SYSU T00039]|uniref:Metalloregulator ArsR/SmtB family transcription factor n=1 Tax=Demequina lignilytica TaxID=3051663 RepID=A0AAW7M518_9MICO|nr:MULTISPECIES: metalloregulator ArsR/SmtB family transcription factor [unclassified Demequina]MDN4478532.1 metalloregulator ArsR/SmtB family transcription factor [Demequina sp. SYSU T00039-1]MDN4486961.1 metalloregulator ArsR/SmtB family transcription factor [Demequina sp. SYSU T00039]
MIELDVVPTACCADERPDLIDAGRAADLAEVFKALADPTRVRLLEHIARTEDGTACACHLPDALGISQPTMSHHMQKLVKAGLVTREQRGRWAHYTVSPDAMAGVRGLLDSVTR